jgi:hypothetical protein
MDSVPFTIIAAESHHFVLQYKHRLYKKNTTVVNRHEHYSYLPLCMYMLRIPLIMSFKIVHVSFRDISRYKPKNYDDVLNLSLGCDSYRKDLDLPETKEKNSDKYI